MHRLIRAAAASSAAVSSAAAAALATDGAAISRMAAGSSSGGSVNLEQIKRDSRAFSAAGRAFVRLHRPQTLSVCPHA